MIFGDWDWDMCLKVRTQEARGEEKKAIEAAVIAIKDLNSPKKLVFEKMKLTPEQIQKVEEKLKSVVEL